jgi:hypothetical protein
MRHEHGIYLVFSALTSRLTSLLLCSRTSEFFIYGIYVFRKTFEKMEEFSFVTPVTGLNRPNTGKEDDGDVFTQ